MQDLSTMGVLTKSFLSIFSGMPQECKLQAERQNIGPANSSGEQVGSKMLICSTVENIRAKVEARLAAKPPKQLSSLFCGSFGQ